MALSGERLDKVMTMPDPSGEDKISHGDSYAFDSVSFHYAADSNVIHGVSFETPAGALTALVGPSGSGKSTLLRLMARFWDYQQGQVRFAGKRASQHRAGKPAFAGVYGDAERLSVPGYDSGEPMLRE